MIQAVESVLGEVQADRITERPSSGGQYLSVKIGPVVVMNPDQVGILLSGRHDVHLQTLPCACR